MRRVSCPECHRRWRILTGALTTPVAQQVLRSDRSRYEMRLGERRLQFEAPPGLRLAPGSTVSVIFGRDNAILGIADQQQGTWFRLPAEADGAAARSLMLQPLLWIAGALALIQGAWLILALAGAVSAAPLAALIPLVLLWVFAAAPLIWEEPPRTDAGDLPVRDAFDI